MRKFAVQFLKCPESTDLLSNWECSRVSGRGDRRRKRNRDISHSSSHTVVATVTKGTLIYPISRSLQLSHNVTASCSRVTCSCHACMCVSERNKEREREREQEREDGCVCVYFCKRLCEWDRLLCLCVCNDSSASCSLVEMTRSCQINIITIRV